MITRHAKTIDLIKHILEMDLLPEQRDAMLDKAIQKVWRDGYEFAKETVNEWYQPKPW